MAKSKVFLSKPEGAWQRIDKLFSRSGIRDKIEKGDIVAIKLHFGELGNTRYIHPIFARKVVDLVKDAGGEPFLTDTTTLYKHARESLLSHLETAAKNGFTRETMGCPIIIADGLRGTNGKWIKLDSFCKLEQVKVAQSIYESDFLLSLAHITLHMNTGFAGSIKNVAMGCATKETKYAMHASKAKPVYDEEKCTLCLRCIKVCPGKAFYKEEGRVKYEAAKCVGCGECIAWCPSEAISVPWGSVLSHDIQKGMIDGFKGIVSIFGEKVGFINLGFDITPDCDCWTTTRLPAAADIGIIASLDPLACDKASCDLVMEAPAYPGSEADKNKGKNKIEAYWPDIEEISKFWKDCQKMELGNLEYDVETISSAT